MSPTRKPANLAASARARLHNLARQRQEELQLILSEFASERLLYRLGVSRYAEDYVLKGATAFKLWLGERHRATWDLDLHGRGSNEVEHVVAVVRELCSIAAEDGIVFDLDSITGSLIRSADKPAGVRVRLRARLTEALIPMQIDVGFGDSITPAPISVTYPTLLDHPAPAILAYPREVVVAEKLDAILSLGITTSRMKDFYDLHVLASSTAFEGARLAAAIRATLARRGTPLPDSPPLVLTREFLGAPERGTQWRAFLRRGRLEAPPDAGELADGLWEFLGPVLDALGRGEVLRATWPPGGPWRLEAKSGMA